MSPNVAASIARADGPLKLAVPRGALFGETLDVLDAVGVWSSPAAAATPASARRSDAWE
jgi:hypothetical protein